MSKHQPDGLVWHDDDQPHATYPVMPDPDTVNAHRCSGCNGVITTVDCVYCSRIAEQQRRDREWRQRDDYGKYRSDHVGKRQYRQ